ncbi:hypothetical protein EYC87_08225 [Halieaceae bacterium IMCC8485]|uniref:Aminoglycoside phosphotransferase domain-containing protein n=1 Tax=Candidatus Seongchinamella marina TaxID=2518990 RepID=A0ABT3SU97_9GAMM|nr:phosphotransferase [Candidatus Seongchinamella marina]MCX2973567.1 hypothetical protein [Candidatus Seongchinamella marina]
MMLVRTIIYWDPALREIEDRNTRAAMYEQMAKTLASIHRVDIEAAGLAGYGRPGNYFERQVGRWTKQYCASELDKIDAMDELIAWLRLNR